MDWKSEGRTLAGLLALFLAFYFLPVGNSRFDNAVFEALHLLKWYAREHVLLCLVPAFFIAGAISTFLSQASVMRYLGPNAPKGLAYAVASVSGTILAVCSCTVLPLFNGIYKMGAGLGPGIAFLYSGPAISVLSIILTARILGLDLGAWRALGAIVFSVVIGLLMALLNRREENDKIAAALVMPPPEDGRPLYETVVFFASMVGVLVFANFGKPEIPEGLWYLIWSWKWPLTTLSAALMYTVVGAWYGLGFGRAALAAAPALIAIPLFPGDPLVPFVAGTLGLSFVTARDEGQAGEWFRASWENAKMIIPLLFAGVFAAGFLLGRPGGEGVIPNAWVSSMVGGNSLFANFFASLFGAFMYFATLTEVPILQGLMGSGMGKGPALALLLAGPALSLPSMLVLAGIMGWRKTMQFVTLVVLFSTIAGMIYGSI